MQDRPPAPTSLGSPPRLPRSSVSRRTLGSLVMGATAAAVLADSCGPSPTSRPAPHTPGPATATATGFRPLFHLTPERAWMNDPQRPFFLDGRWHLYYLFNADHPDGNGTSWYHVTSTDLVHWNDEGVAIEKYVDGLGDVQTGSAVVDTDDTAGLGPGTVVALATQQDDGVQRQSLFSSTDGGHTFQPYAANPVMDNPGVADWRDPKVVRDEDRSEWVMVLAEGDKLGFYTSPDLKAWTYRSDFRRDDLGLLECPDLFEMSVDGDPGRTTWVLAASADGARYGRSANLAYWTGTWDGTSFEPDRSEPLWLDSGPDFYAAVTWDDPRLPRAERLAQRYALGWMNNWAYARDLPTSPWAGGMQSVTRRLALLSTDAEPVLRSTPVDAVADLETETPVPRTLSLPQETSSTVAPAGSAYRLRMRIGQIGDQPAREVRLRVSEDVTVGYSFTDRSAFLVREHTGPDALPPSFSQTRTAPATATDGVVALDVLVDTSAVEVFVNGGEQTFSALDFSRRTADPVVAEAVGGAAQLTDVSVVPLRSA